MEEPDVRHVVATLPPSSLHRRLPRSPSFVLPVKGKPLPLHRGPRSRRPTHRRDAATINKLVARRKRRAVETPHAIQTVRASIRLTSCAFRISGALESARRSTSSAVVVARDDKSESYVVRRISRKENSAALQEKDSRKSFFAIAQKEKRRSLERRSHRLKENARSAHCLDAGIQTRHAARGGIGCDDARGAAALDLGLRGAQGRLRALLVAGGNRLFDLLDRAAHAAAAGSVHGSAALGLAGALLRRFMIGHSVLVLGRARLYEPHGGGSTPPKSAA